MHGLKEIVWANEETQRFWEGGKQQFPTLRVGNLDFTDERFKAAWDKMLKLSIGGKMKDPTENIRRELIKDINSGPSEREILEDLYGQVWNTDELREEFTVEYFVAPYVIVKRKADGVKGTMTFKHSPRFYFSFEEA